MKPPFPLVMSIELLSFVPGASHELTGLRTRYEEMRMLALSRGDMSIGIHARAEEGSRQYEYTSANAITRTVFSHANVPSLPFSDEGGARTHASFVYDPTKDLWTWTGPDDTGARRHLRGWWVDRDMYDRYVNFGRLLTVTFTPVWEGEG